MSCSYAEGLSPYEYKGKLGLSEKFDQKEELEKKVIQFAEWLNKAKHVVVHTGAGISTSAGIPDFRGPNGVWTLEEKGLKPNINTSFDDAVPTYTHMALVKLVEHGKVHYVVSQNIDGLHLKSSLSRSHLSELHGNMFIDECDRCERQCVRNLATKSVGQKSHGVSCPLPTKGSKRPCRGQLCDTILDWEAHLPEKDLKLAEYHSSIADLSIALGTTLQIVPSGNLPTFTKKHGGHLVICNLQPTKHDKKADLIINSYVDEIMMLLMKALKLTPDPYDVSRDPTKYQSSITTPIEWTIQDSWVKSMNTVYSNFMKKVNAKKRESRGTKRNKDSQRSIGHDTDVKAAKLEDDVLKDENRDGQKHSQFADNPKIKEESSNISSSTCKFDDNVVKDESGDSQKHSHFANNPKIEESSNISSSTCKYEDNVIKDESRDSQKHSYFVNNRKPKEDSSSVSSSNTKEEDEKKDESGDGPQSKEYFSNISSSVSEIKEDTVKDKIGDGQKSFDCANSSTLKEDSNNSDISSSTGSNKTKFTS